MSIVTNIILTCSLSERHKETFLAIEEINKTLEVNDYNKLTYLNGNEGGNRVWECAVFGGAFNYLDFDMFAAALKTAKWVRPESVSIFINHEGEEIMKEVKLFPEEFAFNESAERLQSILNQQSPQ